MFVKFHKQRQSNTISFVNLIKQYILQIWSLNFCSITMEEHLFTKIKTNKNRTAVEKRYKSYHNY